MQWTLHFTINSDDVFALIERASGEPLTADEKEYGLDLMDKAFAGSAEVDHPTRVAMLGYSATYLAAEIKRHFADPSHHPIFDQFPKLAPDGGDTPRG